MTIFQNKNMSTLVVIMMVLFFAAISPLHGRIWSNDGQVVFGDTPPDGGLSFAAASSSSMKTDIILGAAHFVKSYSESLMMFNKFELSDLQGVDFNELRSSVDQAIYNLILTLDYYDSLINKADNTPYNDEMVGKLIQFDYNAFRHEKNLNRSVFNEVKYYLSYGDVRGYFREVRSRIGVILAELYNLNNSLYADTLPSNSDVWRLNQNFVESYLFGQYAAEVFFRIGSGE